MRNITNKENKTLGFLKRNLKQCSSYTKEKACKAIARPTVIQARTLCRLKWFCSLLASSPVWASKMGLARTRERAARPLTRAFSRGSLHLPK